MTVNYFITAKSNETLEGINVSLNAEFKEGELPQEVTISANGQRVRETKPIGYMSLNAKYNIASNDFTNLSGSNLESDFVSALVLKVQEFYNTIREGQGGML